VHEAVTSADRAAPGNVNGVASDKTPLGYHPPQQARSRAALQRVLTAAEQVLASGGSDELTMAAVAERAGVSVGSIYSRFAGKDQLLVAVKDRLLTRMEEDLARALGATDGGLSDVVEAFTRALAEGFSAGAHVIPYVLRSDHSKEATERGIRGLETIQRLFLDAAMNHVAEIRRSDPPTALLIAVRTIMGACVYRTVAMPVWPDGTSWARWATEVSGMAVAYLTTSDAG
jgi:AcrR family transcriptional regulator